jgi:hypothetical protein
MWDISSFTPVRKVQLSLYKFARNTQSLNNILWTSPVSNICQITLKVEEEDKTLFTI